MGRIRLLSDLVASQVAAGEVVERPASVVKELVENALDAGARQIGVEVAGGGTGLIRVSDDGCGMDREDALMALERHATSKISATEDLERVRTMGFRGEALPSIASVAKFVLRTCPQGGGVGTEVTVEGGRVREVREAGCAPGTVIEVRGLFHNVPARRKFLRSEATELGHVERVLQGLALGRPEVAFHYSKDGRSAWRLPAAESLEPRVGDLFGADLLVSLANLPVLERGGLRVSGLLGRPGQDRADRALQFFLVNGRAVESPVFTSALREMGATLGLRGRHLPAILLLHLDPAAVDCNVHPAKREVRFRQPTVVREVLKEALEQAILAPRREWLQPVWPHLTGAAPPIPPSGGASLPEPRQAAVQLAPLQPPLPQSAPSSPAAVPPPPPAALAAAAFRVIGSLGGDYVLLESSDGLVLLDQRAARQRISYEEMRRACEGTGLAAQRLLAPVVVELRGVEADILRANGAELARLGFGFEPFGERALKVDELPDLLAGRDPARVLQDVAAACLEGSPPRSRWRLGQEAVCRVLSRLAAGGPAPDDPAAWHALTGRLLSCEMPYASPDGRPTLIQFSFAELDRKFGRTR